jgi:hypothetical protein
MALKLSETCSHTNYIVKLYMTVLLENIYLHNIFTYSELTEWSDIRE